MRTPLLCLGLGLTLLASGRAATAPATPNPALAADRAWLAAQPAAPAPELTKHGLVAKELRRFRPRGANQGVAVDAGHFYGIGNYVVGKYDKRSGERVA